MNPIVLVMLIVVFFLALGIITAFMEYKKRKLLKPNATINRTFLVKGVNTIALGLALLIGLNTMGRGPWLLGGLIPIFIGNFYMIFYLFMDKEN